MPTQTAFAAFREAVLDDFHLQRRLRSSMDRESFVAKVIEVAGSRGFTIDHAAVCVAMREGEDIWLATGGEAA